MKLRGTTVALTGASRGIGQALAKALARAGAHLLLTALEADELAAVSDNMAKEFRVATAFYPADLTADSERRALVEWIRNRDPVPSVLVNNAGAGRFGSFSGSSWESIEQTLRLDAHAPSFLIHELLPILKAQAEAMIVNISSAVGRLPYPGLATYGAAKNYVSALSASLQCELAGTRVRLLCFHPGFTESSFISSANMDLRKIPRFMISSPERVAGRIVRAMERNSSWVYADPASRIGVTLADLLPHRLRIRLFRNLFWEMPR